MPLRGPALIRGYPLSSIYVPFPLWRLRFCRPLEPAKAHYLAFFEDGFFDFFFGAGEGGGGACANLSCI